jgi:hypothetical protein
MLGIISKNTILKAIHNICLLFELDAVLGIISKNTILKAIHNTCLWLKNLPKVGNYK